MKRITNSVLLCTTALAVSAGLTPAWSAQPLVPMPWQSLDQNGVDLATGSFNYSHTDIAIGPRDGGLSYGETDGSSTQRQHSYDAEVFVSGTSATVIFAGVSDMFTQSGASYVSALGRGSQLIVNGSVYTYYASDGTKITFAQPDLKNGVVLASQISTPTGIVTTYHWKVVTPTCASGNDCSDPSTLLPFIRLQGLSTNRGYALKLDHKYDGTAYTDLYDPWSEIVAVTAINTTLAACNIDQDASCSGLPGSRSAQYGFSNTGSGYAFGIVDPVGNRPSFNFTYYFGLTNIRKPADSVDDYTVTYGADRRVQTVVRPWGAWTYTWQADGSGRVTGATVMDPTGVKRALTFDPAINKPLTDTVGTSVLHTTTYQYSSTVPGQLILQTAPEGNSIGYQYDTRGNVMLTTRSAKPSAGTNAAITTSAVYPGSCSPSTAATCNKPTKTVDSLKKATDYTYNPDGTTSTVTSPTGSNLARPQVRYGYTTVSVGGAPGFKVLQSDARCASGGSGTGCADEVVTTYGYGSDPNQLVSSVTSGGSSATATASYSYTPDGDMRLASGPRTGMVTRYIYDANRRPTLVVGPVPSTGLKNRAVRTIYDGNGQTTSVYAGTAADQSDNASQTFVGLLGQTSYYFNGQLKFSYASGAPTGIKTDYAYDAANRLLSTTLEMQGQGADRVTANAYNPDDGTLTSVTSGTGTDAIAVGYTYTLNGQQASMTDGAGNRTGFAYDGFDRLKTRSYPNASGGGSSSTDVDSFTYDAASNALTAKLRGVSQTYKYDAFGNVTQKSAPATTYAYDNSSRLTTATPTTGGLPAVTLAYDALGRMTTQATGVRALRYQYDSAGNRTQMTFPDGFAVTYTYDLANEMTGIADPSTPGLIGFTYDDLGRRNQLNRANGRSTGYSYDNASRLATLTQPDVNFAFTYNPAGQILTRNTSNDAYVFTPTTRTTNVTPNGRDQIAAIDNGAVTYAASANVLSSKLDGGSTWTYADDADRHLTSASKTGFTGTLAYDGGGRLATTTLGGSGTTYLYDGADLVAEYEPSGAARARYVHGPGSDEPLVWYDLAGGQRRFLLADERGSVISAVDDGGNVVARQAYDAWGRGRTVGTGGVGLLGRFGYTGQAWLPEIGLYHYKARAYDPSMGRFVQSDPAGVAGGINLYAYAGGDPVNFVDPSGLGGQPAINEFRQAWQAGPDTNPPAQPSDLIVVTGQRYDAGPQLADLSLQQTLRDIASPDLTRSGNPNEKTSGDEIVVTGRRIPKDKAKPTPIPQSPALAFAMVGNPSVSKEQSTCSAIVGGALALVTPELISGTLNVFKGASVAEVLAEGVAAAAGSTALVAAVAIGGGLYIYDRYSGGRVSHALARIHVCN